LKRGKDQKGFWFRPGWGKYIDLPWQWWIKIRGFLLGGDIGGDFA
jgi:hypothetical protein